MHELSIASSLVDIVGEAARGAHARRVLAVHLRLGALAGVAVDSLQFCYEVAAANTLLAGSRLVVEHLPVVVHCSECDREMELPGLQQFACLVCGTPSADIRRGRELEIESIEIEEQECHERSNTH
jgi:hydrogenase nickel incorporation protein HypA/HybF